MINRSLFANEDLFCYFSGTTLGLCKVTAVRKDKNFGTCHITLTTPDDARIPYSPYVQLDGVLCAVVGVNKQQLSVVTTDEMISNTTLKYITQGNNVSLGIMANLEEKGGFSVSYSPFSKSCGYRGKYLDFAGPSLHIKN